MICKRNCLRKTGTTQAEKYLDNSEKHKDINSVFGFLRQEHPYECSIVAAIFYCEYCVQSKKKLRHSRPLNGYPCREPDYAGTKIWIYTRQYWCFLLTFNNRMKRQESPETFVEIRATVVIAGLYQALKHHKDPDLKKIKPPGFMCIRFHNGFMPTTHLLSSQAQQYSTNN